jgi:Domain of unknown function (DUF5666)
LKIRTPADVAGQDFELRGLIAAANPGQLSFVIRGVTVIHSAAATEFRNGSASGLTVGANVEVRGLPSADGTRLLARRITFK